jgi:hypothetical protein
VKSKNGMIDLVFWGVTFSFAPYRVKVRR